ncbi:TylF/MycF/NovP-related O-methyltransferase [Pseudanabaena galeata UHCC 0370]|uniref:TylF/MycF/NovP-related O-methyltransferase n=1 Tax=Pseudanabaena galeata UHCC 0370 TaxID=3110310 RepID=A0ABU5TL80_9CYAN|nr:TylF/MycF/NovP-related O-methyltransferase [Pseudanabaena galeata]MEA5478333.1 TylF/MycF/NovP-related O-methyltransferase [Pseudanabaena galeata UHCC 0370]
MKILRSIVKKIVEFSGYSLVKTSRNREDFSLLNQFADFSQSELEIIKLIKPFTMTSPERIYALIKAIEYISNNNIRGDIVECGVWKGGSMMAIAHTLLGMNDINRNLYLFDTFEGMTCPSQADISFDNDEALKLLQDSDKEDQTSIWCYAPLEEVMTNLHSTGYASDKIYFVKGEVEKTIPEKAPEQIAVLRLDTDWYESTRHELENLFPRLVRGGVIIIDDYGYWKGCRKATDEYIANNKIQILLNRIDLTGRIGIKL